MNIIENDDFFMLLIINNIDFSFAIEFTLRKSVPSL